MNTKQVLALRFHCDDLDRTVSIREWLVQLLATLWEEGESFSGKRPFGNSGWQWDVAKVLIEHEVIEGKIDEDGYLETCNDKQLNDTITKAIETLGAL